MYMYVHYHSVLPLCRYFDGLVYVGLGNGSVAVLDPENAGERNTAARHLVLEPIEGACSFKIAAITDSNWKVFKGIFEASFISKCAWVQSYLEACPPHLCICTRMYPQD